MENQAVIKIELDFLRNSICVALDEMQVGLNDYLKQEIERCVSEGHLTSLIQQQVRDGVRRAIATSMSNYFSFGEGGKVIEAAVQSKIREKLNLEGK